MQLYKCNNCERQFRGGMKATLDDIWKLYIDKKQSIADIAEVYNVSVSTIKRKLRKIVIEWEQPNISGGGYVHFDVTYWGHNWGVIIAVDHGSGKVIYLNFIQHEKAEDYLQALQSIKSRGFVIKGVIIDGFRALFDIFSDYEIQMCHFHMKQIVTRYLTSKPRLQASKELAAVVEQLDQLDHCSFLQEFADWNAKWHTVLCEKTFSEDTGKWCYTHKKLRTVVNSLNFYMEYLFTYLSPKCVGIPNTNNMIEGLFSILKKRLNVHSGMKEESRKRFIKGFFKAWNNKK